MSNKPTHRVSFSRITGQDQDQDGNDILGSARQIGAIWARDNNKGSILRLDHIPVEMTKHQGVIFVSLVETA